MMFLAVDAAVAPQKVLYPACRYDVSPSLVFPDVTYVDDDKGVATFFGDIEGVLDIVAECSTAPQDAVFRFIRAEVSRLVLPKARFDLVISLADRPVAMSCRQSLKTGGRFLVGPEHRDAEILVHDSDFELSAVMTPSPDGYRFQDVDRVPFQPRTGQSGLSGERSAHRIDGEISYATALVFTHVG